MGARTSGTKVNLNNETELKDAKLGSKTDLCRACQLWWCHLLGKGATVCLILFRFVFDV